MSALERFILDCAAEGRWKRGLLAMQGALSSSKKTEAKDFHFALLEKVFPVNWVAALQVCQSLWIRKISHLSAVIRQSTNIGLSSHQRDQLLLSFPSSPEGNLIRSRWLSTDCIDTLVATNRCELLDATALLLRFPHMHGAIVAKFALTDEVLERLVEILPSWSVACSIVSRKQPAIPNKLKQVALQRLAEHHWVAALARCSPESAPLVVLHGLANNKLEMNVVRKIADSSTGRLDPAELILRWFLTRTETREVENLCRTSRLWAQRALSLPVEWERALSLIARSGCWDHVPSRLLRRLSHEGKDHLAAYLADRTEAQSDTNRTVNFLQLSATSSKLWPTAISLALRSSLDPQVTRAFITIVGLRKPALWEQALSVCSPRASREDIAWLSSLCSSSLRREELPLCAKSDDLQLMASKMASGYILKPY